MMLVCSVLLATHSAQAFYNPSTGRWLSRDPKHEDGGKNLYAFIDNNVPNKRDAVGLCDPGQKKTCGEDVTLAVSRTLADIRAAYWTWPTEQKRTACDTLVGLGQQPYSSAWDIDQLAYFTPLFSKYVPKYPQAFKGGTKPDCQWTLTFGGSCFYGAQINYAMWGAVNNLCHRSFPNVYVYVPIPVGSPPVPIPVKFELWSYSMTVELVYAWKFSEHGQWPWNDHVRQAVEFTEYGYGKSFPVGPNLNSQCPPNLTPCSQRRFNWTWEPVKPRAPIPGA